MELATEIFKLIFDGHLRRSEKRWKELLCDAHLPLKVHTIDVVGFRLDLLLKSRLKLLLFGDCSSDPSIVCVLGKKVLMGLDLFEYGGELLASSKTE